MKKELIQALLRKFEAASHDLHGTECWSARELREILGYSTWQKFQNAIEKAKESCSRVGEDVVSHFADILTRVEVGNSAQRNIEDIALTRYACYLIAQNSDSSNPEIAFAQTYFAVQTRKQEIIEKHLLDVERVAAREKLTSSEKKLSGVIYERGIDNRGFGFIRSKGDQALFGGYSTGAMKRKLGVPQGRALADFLPTLTIKAKDFATELTSHNVIEKDLRGEGSISNEHVDNNAAVRKMLRERGVSPESLPAAEDASKVKRKLESEKKKVLKDGKKLKS
ncbi:MAG: DNA damage-inducible protein D [Pyrinomonadaceae bacterium]